MNSCFDWCHRMPYNCSSAMDGPSCALFLQILTIHDVVLNSVPWCCSQGVRASTVSCDNARQSSPQAIWDPHILLLFVNISYLSFCAVSANQVVMQLPSSTASGSSKQDAQVLTISAKLEKQHKYVERKSE
jgi:hypothetical protein